MREIWELTNYADIEEGGYSRDPTDRVLERDEVLNNTIRHLV